MNHIVIGGAWPYANGSLHIGHIAALLPGDVLARYWRSRGADVYYVSGSDCHGTPITIRAKQDGRTPEEICGFYHQEFCDVFQKLGFSYDLYTKTSDRHHKDFVQSFHRKLYESNYIEQRTVKQAYCLSCQKVLADRLILGTCPVCGEPTRGDQCDACGEVLDADTILNARCAECGNPLTFGSTTQLFLLISKLEHELKELVNTHPYWRKNAIAFTNRYITEGLHDRAITRDLDWGIDVPRTGYEDKKIYIWAENVLGYLSGAAALCQKRNTDFSEVFGDEARHYYVHGKDNIPFHTIILPSLLLAHGNGLHLPDDIISSEYMTLEGRKISTSNNWAVWAKDLDSKIPSASYCPELKQKIDLAYQTVGTRIEHGQFKDALSAAFELVRFGNKYYDANEPWKTRKADPAKCKETIGNCIWLIANLSVLLHPFLPFSSGQILGWLGLTDGWKEQQVSVQILPKDFSVLFKKIL